MFLLWIWDQESMAGQVKATIGTGWLPTALKRASGVICHTPSNNDYTQLNMHCKTLQPSCMRKVVEYEVVELLSEEAEWRGLLIDGQFSQTNG